MPTLTVNATAYSIQSAKPGRRFGQAAKIPVTSGASSMLLRASLAGVPTGATVVSATLSVWQWGDASGSRTLNVRTATSAWTSAVTWNTRPSVSAVVESATKSAPAGGTRWDFDVQPEVQQAVTGSRSDRGWQVNSSQTSILNLVGSSHSARQPRLTVVYTVPPPAPSNLHPSSGSVAVDKPALTFDADPAVTAIRVQVDPAADAASPDFDSGEVVTGGGLLDLADTAYPGLAAGATTFWRAQQKTAGGWSEWSEWAGFSRLAMPTLTITSPPAGAVGDGTPPVTWTFSGAQVAWQARLLDGDGDPLADSGFTPGTATDWTPAKGLTRNGQQGVIELRVWDDSDRVATPGSPDYARVTREVTYTMSAATAPVASLEASQPNLSPTVALTGTRAEVPDQLDVIRDGATVLRVEGPDAFTGTSFLVEDPGAPMNVPVTYRVAPRVNGATASGGPTVTIVPRCRGVWLTDLETGEQAVIWNADADQSQPEDAVLHAPLTGAGQEPGQVVRRRLVRRLPEGSVSGLVVDALTGAGAPTAAETEARLRAWALNDAGHLYRLTLGNYSGQVIIGDLTFSERQDTNELQRVLDVSFSWWEQA